MSIQYNTIDQITNRINKVYQANAYVLSNSPVQGIMQNFIAIDDKTIDDLDNLRVSLNYCKDNELGGQSSNIAQYHAINEVLSSIENEYYARVIGYSKFDPKAASESFDGGNTYVVTIKSLIGPGRIDAISDTLTGAFGNTPLPSTTLLNVITPAENSLTAALNSLTQAVENAVGSRTPLAMQASLTLNSCTTDSLGEVIFETPSKPSLIDQSNGMYACAAWQLITVTYGLTNTGNYEDCYIFSEAKALSGCMYYLTGYYLSNEP